MIEISKVECCANCQHYKTLYVPPLDANREVAKAVGGKKNGRMCVAYEAEFDEVMYLGKVNNNADNGMCEMFTAKEIDNENKG